MQQYRKNLGKVSLTAEGAWNNAKEYDILSIVYDENTQHGFLSRQAVPVGVDLYNSEYWMPLNVSGYVDNNIIILSKKISEATIQSYTLEEAITSIKSVGRRPGAILGFYNENADRLDIGSRWELWQFNDTNIYNWDNVDSWQNLYYNYNKFMGWFKDENFLTKYAPFPEIGCYAFVGSEFNEATVYRCDNKYVWNNTAQHAWDYVKVIVDGNVTVGENGNWFNNGEDTGIPASVKGENGKTPVFREKDNTIQYSFDSLNWITISDKVAAWFRWNATTGDTQANNVGRIQISRDKVTWTNLSGDIINNLHISRYVGADESLPTNGIAEGTIYAKGPTYDTSDTSHANPIYRLWVYAWKGNTLAWQDNGEFTSIAAGVVQETGNSENAVMSQKAVTDKLSELGSKSLSGDTINLLNPTFLGEFVDNYAGSDIYKSHNPMILEAGHQYGLYKIDEYSGSLIKGTGYLNVLVVSDNYGIQKYADSKPISIPEDAINPIGYVTNYADRNERINYSKYMFVDITDGEPVEFIPYYTNKLYANKISDVFGYVTFYSGGLSVDTEKMTVTAEGRFFVNTPFRRLADSIVDVTINKTTTNIESDSLYAIHYLCFDVQDKSFYVLRASSYKKLILNRAIVIVGVGPLSKGGSDFYSLSNNLTIDGNSYISNPASILNSVIKKDKVRTANLFNYEDETYKNKIISDDGVWSANSNFSTVAIPLETGKTYIRYNRAGVIGNWNYTNVRVFGEDGNLLLKGQLTTISIPEDAINPVGYFAFYNSADGVDTSLFMVLPEEVSGDEQLPYIKGVINDKDLISFIESKLKGVDISKQIVQTSGSASDKVMSQSAVTNYVENKIKDISARQVAQTVGNSTEIPMSQKAVTDALSDLSEQIQGEPVYRFAERPDNGYENFLVDVNCSIADNTTVSNAVQDSRDIKQDRCILKLPVNYSRSGEPVRLVICGHGTGWKCTASTTIPWAGMNTQLLLDEGYAVLGCNGTPGELDGLDQGHNCVPECYRSILSAYKYVIEKYNIKRDGVLTAGLSMGTYMTGQIALFNEIPVLAQVFYGFSGEIWKAQYTFKPSVRKRMTEKFGFTGEAPSFNTSNPPTSAEQKYIKDNIDKWSGYDVLVAGITNKNILDTFNVWVNSSTLTSEDEATLYKDAIVVGRPPCKFFVCDDDTTSPARWSEYMATMIRNGGGYAEVRHYAAGGHNSWGVGSNISITTKYGGTKTINGSSYEGLLFLQKFDH